MKNIFAKIFTKTRNITISTQINWKNLNSIVNKNFFDPSFLKLSNAEREKIIEKLIYENKDAIIIEKVKIKINERYFLINKFFQVIAKLKSKVINNY